ncbi:hypothetical protein V6525_003586 [Salmonella enterica]
MFYVDNNSGSPTMPALSPANSNTPTWFTEGDKDKGVSYIGQDWLNIIQSELLNILNEAGITPDKGKLDQLTLSIKAIIAKNAFTQKNNLKEIQDAGSKAQEAARGYLGLGKIATLDALSQLVLSPTGYAGFSTSLSQQLKTQAPYYLVPVTLGAGDIFIPFVKEQALTPDGKTTTVSFGLNKRDKSARATPAIQAIKEDDTWQLWEFSPEDGRITNNQHGDVAFLEDFAPTKKAIDDTQTGLPSQGVMWISSADDLSNLPSGARRFAINNTGVTVLPSADYFFLEVLAKRDTSNGSCILATSNTGNVWIGLRYAVPGDAAFTWTQLNQNVQNLGLTEAVNRALNAVQKTGDTMTGNLFLKNDARVHFAIANADGNARMWLYKDKGGDGVRLNNGVDGGGEFVFGKSGEFYSPSSLHAGSSIFGNNGDVYGSAWGNKWLTAWLSNAFTSRDNNINTRATIAWVNQNFVKDVRMGANRSGIMWGSGGGTVAAGYVLTGGNFDDDREWPVYAPVQKNVNGIWYNVGRE